MLNAIEHTKDNISLVNTNLKSTNYELMPASWIARDIYSALLNTHYNNDFLAKFDNIPQTKLNETLKSYLKFSDAGLLTDMYINLGIGIRDLKSRILHIINLVSFKDKEKRAIWKLYGELNDFDDFIEDHNAVIIKKIDSLLVQISK